MTTKRCKTTTYKLSRVTKRAQMDQETETKSTKTQQLTPPPKHRTTEVNRTTHKTTARSDSDRTITHSEIQTPAILPVQSSLLSCWQYLNCELDLKASFSLKCIDKQGKQLPAVHQGGLWYVHFSYLQSVISSSNTAPRGRCLFDSCHGIVPFKRSISPCTTSLILFNYFAPCSA